MPLTISKEQFENVLRNVSSIYPLQGVGAGVGLGAAAGLNLQVINTQQQYDEATMANEIQKIDSVHDFGSTRGNNLATDNITKVKAVVNSNVVYYSYNQMTLSFIQKYSFPNVPGNWCAPIQNIPIQLFSNFSYPGAAPLQRAVNDVEDYCFLLQIKHGLATGLVAANFMYQSMPALSNIGQTFSGIKQAMSDFFQDYRDNGLPADGTQQINFLVDTPGDFTKILKSNNAINDFAYILLQESAHDSAKGKPTPLEPVVIQAAYQNNAFVEIPAYDPPIAGDPPAQVRTYNSGINGVRFFESNYGISFNGFSYDRQNGREYFKTNVTYNKPNTAVERFICILNSLDHPTNVPQITRAIGAVIKGNNLVLAQDSQNLLPSPPVANSVNPFYVNFNNHLPAYDLPIDSRNLIDFNFTKKRAGDGLQARVCQYVNALNSIGIQCWKMATSATLAVNVRNGRLSSERIYTIKKLILVTIDRVLFSYCVKHRIPAVYSGTKGFLFFKPPAAAAPAGAGLAAPVAGAGLAAPVANAAPAGAAVAPAGAARQSSRLANQRGGNPRLNKQKGGQPIAARPLAIPLFSKVPFCLYKLLPKIILFKNNDANLTTAQKTGCKTIIDTLQKIPDDHVKTKYANNKICLFTNVDIDTYSLNPGLNTLPQNYVIWLYDTIRVFEMSNNPGDFVFTYYSQNQGIINQHINPPGIINQYINPPINVPFILFRFTDVDIGNIIDNNNNFTRSLARRLLGILAPEAHGDINVDYLNTILGIQNLDNPDEYQEGGSGTIDSEEAESPSVPLLDLYYNLFFTKDISLDASKLEMNNIASLISYFNMFDRYETMLCFDNEEYYQNFTNDGIEVTQKICMYILFRILLDDFKDKKDKICYGLLEYCLNSGDSSKNYFSISDDLERIIYYLFCDYKVLGTSANNRINEMIKSGIIDTSNPIFTNTITYFTSELYPKILQKYTEIQGYLNEQTSDSATKYYIKNYLSMYGFMNMVRHLDASLNPETGEERIEVPLMSNIGKGNFNINKIIPQKSVIPLYKLPTNKMFQLEKGPQIRRQIGPQIRRQIMYQNTNPILVQGGSKKVYKKIKNKKTRKMNKMHIKNNKTKNKKSRKNNKTRKQ